MTLPAAQPDKVHGTLMRVSADHCTDTAQTSSSANTTHQVSQHIQAIQRLRVTDTSSPYFPQTCVMLVFLYYLTCSI